MAGLLDEHTMHARVRETSQLASEMVALIESIGDPTLTVGLAVWPIAVKIESGEMAEVLRLAQTVIDLAEGDPTKGNFVIGSPLAAALAARGDRPMGPGPPRMAGRSRRRRHDGSRDRSVVVCHRHRLHVPRGDSSWGAPGRRHRAARHQRSAADRRGIRWRHRAGLRPGLRGCGPAASGLPSRP